MRTPVYTWLRRSAAALLLGIATTVLSAWALSCLPIVGTGVVGAATRADPDTPILMTEAHRRGDVYVLQAVHDVGRCRYVGLAWGKRRALTMRNEFQPPDLLKKSPRESVPAWAEPHLFPWFYGLSWPTTHVPVRTNVEAAGWPFYALHSWQVRSVHTGAESFVSESLHISLTGRSRSAGPLRNVRQEPIRLPIIPLWKGFAANTLLFAAAWLLVGFMCRRVVAWVRGKRGLCSVCGYSRSGRPAGSPCPECGRLP